MLREYGVVVHTAGEFPRLFVVSMSLVPETWVVDYLGQIYHREVNTPLRNESHATRGMLRLKAVMEGLLVPGVR